MRNKFFFIILGTLILAAFGINFVHVYFFKNQRLKLIDHQIKESSAILMESPEFTQAVRNPPAIEETISRVLKGLRIGKVFVLRDQTGKIIYQNFTVSLLNVDLPLQPEWVAVESDTEYIRLRNMPIPGTKQVLQVGLVLNQNFLNWEILDNRLIMYVIGIVVSTFLVSVIVTHILLGPLRVLIAHLKETTSDLTNLKDVRPLPTRLTRFTHNFWSRSDEFSSLINAIQKLIDRINQNYKLTRSWTLQMAHELKTPLAIMRAETESSRKNKTIPDSYADDVIQEIEQMSQIIGEFLDWAELENSHLQKDLHALRMKSVVLAVAARLEKISPGRLELFLNSDFSVFASPTHIDQLITNLVTNALKFSPPSQKVKLGLYNRSLVVQDFGPGIPREVKERLGEPFNVGTPDSHGGTGNGLGLAWISTVTRLYQWDFELFSDISGTKATIQFPKEESES